MDEIFRELLNVFGIGDDIYFLGYRNDGTDHDKNMHKGELHTKQKYQFMFKIIPYFSEIISKYREQLDSHKLHALTNMLPHKIKKTLVIPVSTKVSEQAPTCKISMWTTEPTDTSESRLDMEQVLSGPTQPG